MKKKKQEKNPSVFSIGKLDLTLSIDFKDEDLEKKESEGENKQEENKNQKNYYNIEDFNNIKDLSFLKENKKILKRFKVKSKNEMLKLLLFGNLNREKKCQIEYISINIPKFEGEEEFFKDILNFVTQKNGLFLNENPIDKNGNYHIKIEMKHTGKYKEIELGLGEVDNREDDNEIKGEGQSAPEEEQKVEENNDDEDEYGDYEPNEMMKLGFIPKFKRKKSVLCNLCPKSNKYDLIYLNFEDLNKISGNYKPEDMFELLQFFKKKKSTIFINFYQEEKEKEKEEDKKEEEKKEEEKKEEEKKEEKEKNQKENNEKEEPINEELIELNKLYYITDIYFFDKKQSVKIFDEHYKAFTNDKPKKTLHSRNVYDYFSKCIATGTTDEVPYEKTGLFLDEFNKFIIIKVSKKTVNKNELDCQPFPKINNYNAKEVNYYKDIIKKNKGDFYTLFLSEMITSMGASAPKCSSPEAIIPPFLAGVELVKRKIELLKNNIDIEDEENFYKIKKDPKIMSEQLEKLSMGLKEGNFKLDCTNLITSNKKEYVSLYDYHLKNFFSRETIRKELENKGFINNKGYIKYDPVYRNVMGTNNKNKKSFTEKEKKNKIISTIKEIDVHSRLKDKEIDCEKAALNEKNITDKKIPLKVEQKEKKHNKKKNKSSSLEGGSSGSGSSDEENKSGENN